MPTVTTNYSFIKPAVTEPVDITILNNSFDIIDTTLKNVVNATAGVVFRNKYNYSTAAYPARPVGAASGSVEYIGPVVPTDWTDYDTWIDVS